MRLSPHPFHSVWGRCAGRNPAQGGKYAQIGFGLGGRRIPGSGESIACAEQRRLDLCSRRYNQEFGGAPAGLSRPAEPGILFRSTVQGTDLNPAVHAVQPTKYARPSSSWLWPLVLPTPTTATDAAFAAIADNHSPRHDHSAAKPEPPERNNSITN